MPRKTAAAFGAKVIKDLEAQQATMTQEELEAEVSKHTPVVPLQKSQRRGRLRNINGIPSGDAPTSEVVEIVSDAIEVNADALEWKYGENSNGATAKQWAEIVVRAIRYGIPTDEYEGEGFHIREDYSLGDAPECADCQAEE